MSYRDVWKSDYELQRERRDLRDEWPYPSYSREQDAEDRVRDINRELDRREERRMEEAEAERREQRNAQERWQHQISEEEYYQQQEQEQQEEQPPEIKTDTPVQTPPTGKTKE